MTDDRTERALSDWLKATEWRRPGDGRASARAVLARLDPAPTRPAPAVVERSNGHAPRRVRVAIPAAIAAGIAVLAAIALVGSPGSVPESDGRGIVGAPSSPEPAVHWQSRTIDLRADDVVLRIGDEDWRPAEGDLVIDAYDGDGQMALYPRWTEGERTFWLYLTFSRGSDGWKLDQPWAWLDRVQTGDYRDDPTVKVGGADVDLRGPRPRRLIGASYTGDWVGKGTLRRPACTERGWEEVKVVLTFEGLRLTANDWRPSPIDEFMHDMFHRGSMLGDIFRGSLEQPGWVELDCSTDAIAG